jgi:hypothetical protein
MHIVSSSEKRANPIKKHEDLHMNEIRTSKGTKHMKLNFYTQTAPQRIGGERNVHFKFIDNATEKKRMKKKQYKKWHEYRVKRPLLETLNSYIEARKCKTLDLFAPTEKEVRQ